MRVVLEELQVDVLEKLLHIACVLCPPIPRFRDVVKLALAGSDIRRKNAAPLINERVVLGVKRVLSIYNKRAPRSPMSEAYSYPTGFGMVHFEFPHSTSRNMKQLNIKYNYYN